jgi:hypothetical protein
MAVLIIQAVENLVQRSQKTTAALLLDEARPLLISLLLSPTRPTLRVAAVGGGTDDAAGAAHPYRRPLLRFLVQAKLLSHWDTELRELAARVRESQAELDNRSSDLQAGLFSTIEALQESHQRAEGMLDEKIRECEALRAENEKLRMHLKLHSNQSMGESGTPSFSSRW